MKITEALEIINKDLSERGELHSSNTQALRVLAAFAETTIANAHVKTVTDTKKGRVA